MEILNQFDKIYIDEASRSSDLAERMVSLFSSEKIEWVSAEPLLGHKGTLSSQQFNQSKKNIFLTPFKGQFFKRCPGSTQKKTLTCCNYYVFNLGQQCNMNCSYCYLQSYLNTPIMKIYSNIEEGLKELEDMAQDHSHLPYRIGTGEVIDSLSLDEITLYSHKLIAFFKKYPKWTLEFKTKSNKVDQFLNQEHAGNVVVSWSINAPYVTQTEEHGTASFYERMEAAEKCAAQKFPLAFHIDPMIHYPEWQEGYATVVDEIAKRFSPEQIQIMSVGSLRFQPEQRHMMRERFGMKSLVMQSEMRISDSGKMRYDSHLRSQMMDFVIQRFKEKSKGWKIFMCMETPENWISNYDTISPVQIPELKEFFRPLPKPKMDTLSV